MTEQQISLLFLNSVKSNYVLNFVDVPDEQQRFTNLKMYFHTRKEFLPPSHTFSYMQLRKSHMELGMVYLHLEKGLGNKLVGAN